MGCGPSLENPKLHQTVLGDYMAVCTLPLRSLQASWVTDTTAYVGSGYSREGHTKNPRWTHALAPATRHVPDPLLLFRQSSSAKEVVCISENKHAMQRGCSATGLLVLPQAWGQDRPGWLT